MGSVAESPSRLFWLIVLAAFAPFMSVGIEFGFCTTDFWLNLVLSLLIPFAGFIHAVYLLCMARYSNPDANGYERVSTDAEVAVLSTPRHQLVGSPVPAQSEPQASSQQQQQVPSPSAASEPHPPPYSAGADVVTGDHKIQTGN